MPKSIAEVCDRAQQLRSLHNDRQHEKQRIRALMDGGRSAVNALLGDVQGLGEDLPMANLVLSGITRLGQKLGRRPDHRVDPPNYNDSERARKQAEKRERLVEHYDDACWMDMLLPQVGRWLPGYAYSAFVIKERKNSDGFRYPHVELRDPFDTFPGPWGANQQPEDLAVYRRVDIQQLDRLYPGVKTRIRDTQRTPNGAYLLDPGGLGGHQAQGSWDNAGRRGVDVAEYFDSEGMHLVLPDHGLRLDFVENVLESGPQFVVMKRHAFNKLVGHYDQVVGLMAMMAKLNLLAQVGLEDATFAETNIFGEPPAGQYRRGRFAINVFPQGTSVQKMQHNLPYQQFEQINRIERQLRQTAGYPVTDDAQSPNSYVTGAGLSELTSSVAQEVNEYQIVIGRHLELVDAKRLEWDEKAYGGERKPMYGVRKGETFAETYDPAKDINGAYRVRRVYGMMAGWDEPQKIVGGLQLMQGGVISTQTMQENLSGLDNVTREQERIRDEQALNAVYQNLLGMANEGDPRALMAAIHLLPEGEMKTELSKFFTPDEPEMSEEEAAMAEMMAGGGQELPQGAPPDIATVLSRLTQGGQAQGGVQTVGRLQQGGGY